MITAMERNEESMARIRLAWRIFREMRLGGRPILLSEIAELRFLAETDEEREMPVKELVLAVTKREMKRMGIRDPFSGGMGSEGGFFQKNSLN